VNTQPVHYASEDDDSARWLGFPFRRGDIVISARSKSGTTWMQMICALLVFQTPEVPLPLSVLSPWLDWKGTSREQVVAELEAQTHRRFIKTHTPLDGLPLDERATYIVVARHPLDMAVSLYHQGNNLDRRRIGELTGVDESVEPEQPLPIGDWLRAWIVWDGQHTERLDSLPGVMWHLSDAWARRGAGKIVQVHYDDLIADLPGQMRRLAAVLGVEVDDDELGELARAATFEEMQARSGSLAPDTGGVLKSRAAFFRRGSSGAGAELLTATELAHYHERARQLAPGDLVDWLHR
jgi:aryl sulfotransferase